MDPLISDRFRRSLLAVNRAGARALVEEAVADATSVRTLEELVRGTLEQIGADWDRGAVSLAQVYMAGRICEELVDQVFLTGTAQSPAAARTAVVSLIDYHALGKRLVYAAVRSAGHGIKDYGRMDVAELIARVRADRPKVLFVSVLMLSSALRIKEVCAALRGEGLSTQVVVGGAPFLFDANLWQEVGAFAMGHSAFDALRFLPESAEVVS